MIMGLPSKLTPEEQALLNKFALIKKKRKAQNVKASTAATVETDVASILPKKDASSESGKPAKESSVAPKDAKEIAKQLIASGQIKLTKGFENRSFKRARVSQGEKRRDPIPDASSSKEQVKKIDNIKRGTYQSFVPSAEKPDYTENDDDRKHNYDNKRQGNNLFVSGYGLTKEILETSFPKFGAVKKIYFDPDKGHGFVTYQRNESAATAIDALHGEMVSGSILRVVHVRRRNFDDNRFTWRPRGNRQDNAERPRDLDNAVESSKPVWTAEKLSAKTAEKKKARKLVKYDEEDLLTYNDDNFEF